MPRADARARRRATAALLALVLLAGCSSPPETPPEPEAAPTDTGELDAAEPEPEPTPEPEPEPEPDPEPEPEPPPPPPPPPIPEGRDELIAEATRLVAAAADEVASGELAILVVDEHGREIVAHGADDALLPASTLKTVTAAAILSTLGPGHRIRTTVESTASIDADGLLAGDLIVVGGGDPVLATPEYERWVYPMRPRTPLEELADQLVDAGLRRIDGDVLATAPGFDGPRVPDGWPDRYFSTFDARYSDGLTVDAGLRTIVTYPDQDEDEDVEGSDETETTQTAADAASSDEADPDADRPGEDREDEDREDEDRGPPDVRVDHAEDPALQAVTELVRLLEERDVEVAGEPLVGQPEGLVVGRLAAVESPPMIDLLRFAMQRSDNHLTDGLFRLAGHIRTGSGSFDAGDRALRQVLDRYGVDHAQAVFADGSGLSREDRVSARLLVELDLAMTASRHGPAWGSIMASMGESGTLHRRLRGTVAEGRFLGKTGTLRDVGALSGVVRDADGARYHLAVISNDEGMTRAIGRAAVDELILLLVADVDGCDIDRPGYEEDEAEDDAAAGDADDTDDTDDDEDVPLTVIGLPPLVVRC